MKTLILALIHGYQKTISPDHGVFRFGVRRSCTMYPTCSEYAEAVISRDGVILGTWRAIRRVFRCHPWQKRLVDLP
jgi:hypothetical protein